MCMCLSVRACVRACVTVCVYMKMLNISSKTASCAELLFLHCHARFLNIHNQTLHNFLGIVADNANSDAKNH